MYSGLRTAIINHWSAEDHRWGRTIDPSDVWLLHRCWGFSIPSVDLSQYSTLTRQRGPKTLQVPHSQQDKGKGIWPISSSDLEITANLGLNGVHKVMNRNPKGAWANTLKTTKHMWTEWVNSFTYVVAPGNFTSCTVVTQSVFWPSNQVRENSESFYGKERTWRRATDEGSVYLGWTDNISITNIYYIWWTEISPGTEL